MYVHLSRRVVQGKQLYEDEFMSQLPVSKILG
jgi:hypothetical protein